MVRFMKCCTMQSFRPPPALEPPPHMGIHNIIKTIANKLTHSPIHPPPYSISTEEHPVTTTHHMETSSHIQNRQTSELTAQPTTVTHQLNPPLPHNRLTTVRLMRSATTWPQEIPYQLHIDSGANRSIMNDNTQLLHFRNIKPY
jgi:hypothetical protein